jgi:23S rRNA (pseudouridine1915-N3)-methyltransferase
MRLLAVGKASAGTPEMEIFARYAARIKPKLELTEFADGRGSPVEMKRREAEAMLGALAPGEFVIALDAGGVAAGSLELAVLLGKWLETQKKIAFVIGGAEGLDGSVLARAGTVLSLGVMTWPHMLARAMLAEQIYRAQSILGGHPYHRAGRP